MKDYIRFADRFCAAASIFLVLVYAAFILAGCVAEANHPTASADGAPALHASGLSGTPAPTPAAPSGTQATTEAPPHAVSASTLEARTPEAPAETAAPDPTPTVYDAAAQIVAKTGYGEAGLCSTTEQAAVIWCILNRVDSAEAYFPDDIISVALQSNQFQGYAETNPVLPELYSLALDVFHRWEREKNGEQDVGRVLPKGYLYFEGDGLHNHFRTEWRGGTTWDWSLPSPYGED